MVELQEYVACIGMQLFASKLCARYISTGPAASVLSRNNVCVAQYNEGGPRGFLSQQHQCVFMVVHTLQRAPLMLWRWQFFTHFKSCGAYGARAAAYSSLIAPTLCTTHAPSCLLRFVQCDVDCE